MSQDFETEGNQHMLKLTRGEQAWLNDYRKAIEGKYPGVVHEMLIYGSKARGQAHAESDLDVLLVITNEAGDFKKKLRRTGYLLAATSNVLPSILAYTQEEWERRRRNRSSFRQAVERDAVRVV